MPLVAQKMVERALSVLRVRYPEKVSTSQVNMRLPDDVHGPLVEIAQRDGVPLNGLVVEILRAALAEK